MSVRRLAALQWFGVLAAALAWAAQHVVGFGITQARCTAGSSRWGTDQDLAQLVLMIVTAAVIVGAELAALLVFLATRPLDYEGEPPQGRLHFFSIAALAANPIFLTIVLLDGIAAIVDRLCAQS